MPPLVAPAVKPQAGLTVHQILHVQQKLIYRLLYVLRTIKQLADFRQRQNRHHQRVVPHLLMILFRQGDVLHAARLSARHFVHRPLRPAIEPGQIRGVARLFVAVSQGEKRRHGVDVFGGRAFGKAVGKPAINNVAHRRIAGLLVILINTVQADAVSPLPAVPPFGVDNASVVQPQ